jgi:predicted RNA binding protein YcfA (HicA-like mRNA interferase family)
MLNVRCSPPASATSVQGSHRIYGQGVLRVTVPFHSGEVLHPKIIKQVVEMIEEAGRDPGTDE